MAKPSWLQDERNGEICKYIHTERERERERERGEGGGELQRDALGNRVTDIALRQPDIQSFSGYPGRSDIHE